MKDRFTKFFYLPSGQTRRRLIEGRKRQIRTSRKEEIIMTSAQVEYLKLLETQRHNKAQEGQNVDVIEETHRHNATTETEEARHNVESEKASGASAAGSLARGFGLGALFQAGRAASGASTPSAAAKAASSAASAVGAAAAAHPVATGVVAGTALAATEVWYNDKKFRELLEKNGVTVDDLKRSIESGSLTRNEVWRLYNPSNPTFQKKLQLQQWIKQGKITKGGETQ